MRSSRWWRVPDRVRDLAVVHRVQRPRQGSGASPASTTTPRRSVLGVLGRGQEHVHLHRDLGLARAGDRPRDGAGDARGVQGRGLLRTVVLVPWAVLTVVSAITWRTLFEPNLGLAPQILDKIGIGEDVVWLGQEGYAMAVMILADVWKTAPFMALLLLAGLQVIPDDVYDAAKGRHDLAALRADHDPAADARDPRGADLPHARRAADLRPAVRAHRGRTARRRCR